MKAMVLREARTTVRYGSLFLASANLPIFQAGRPPRSRRWSRRAWPSRPTASRCTRRWAGAGS